MKVRVPIIRSLRAVAAAAVIAAVSAAGFGSDALAADKTLAWIPKSTDSSFWLAIKRGAEKAGAELGYEVLYVGTQDQTQIAGQINLVNDMVTRRIDGILIAATDAKALSDPVTKAIEAGVPVITVDSGIDPDTSLAYIATDNIGAARAAAEHLAGLIGGKGKVGDIGITAGSPNRVRARERLRRGDEELSRHRGAAGAVLGMQAGQGAEHRDRHAHRQS